MKISFIILAGVALATSTGKAVVIGFEDLTGPLALDSCTGLQFVNGSNGLTYGSVTWDARVNIVGKNYRTDPVVDPDTGLAGPLFSGGVPAGAGGNYFITNDTSATSNPATTYGNGISLTTDQILLGGYFGSNEYYGYTVGEGADQVTILAMAGSSVLNSLTFDLVLNTQTAGGANTPVEMTYFNTSAFAGLSGITSYVINRHSSNAEIPGNATAASWVADNLVFAPVPEPSTTAVILLGLIGLGRRMFGQRLNASA